MLLALDTATATASLALYDPATQAVLAEQTWQARRRHTQDLLATAQQLMAQLGIEAAQLTALAVTTGPGSFTGVRIAISAVKGLALGLPARPRIVGMPTLCVTAAPWLAVTRQLPAAPTVCAYLQAGRGRYNWTFFAPDQTRWRPGVADHFGGAAAEFAQALAAHPAPIWLVGELDSELDEALEQASAALAHVVVLDAISSGRRAGHLARLASERMAAGQQDDLHTLQPLYLRAP